MNEARNNPPQPLGGWRLGAGVGLFALSIVVPVAGVPALAAFDLPAAMAGVSLAGAEVLGILAVAVLGKPGYHYLKNRVLAFLMRYRPPSEVGRVRYTVGLVMFFVPVLFAWVSGYAGEAIPEIVRNPLPYAIGGDR